MNLRAEDGEERLLCGQAQANGGYPVAAVAGMRRAVEQAPPVHRRAAKLAPPGKK